MEEKKYINADEQIKTLSDKGMSFSQPARAKRLLTENNYYCVTAYKLLFYKPNERLYKSGVDFEHLFSVYSFDKEFKMIILKHLLMIEQKIKTALSNQISLKYGIKENQYLKKTNYDLNNPHIDENLKKLREQVRVFGRKNTAVSHYKQDHGFIPFWVLSKCITMGVVRDLFDILKPSDQSFVVQSILVKNIEKKPVKKVKNMIALFADIRNMCAHDEFLIHYSHRRITISPLVEHSHIHCLKNENGNYVQGISDLTALLISIKYFVNRTTYNELIQDISSSIDKCYKRIKDLVTMEEFLKYIGLPSDYENLKKL